MTLTPVRGNGVSRSIGCLDAELLASYVDGRTSPAERASVEAHLARCEDCYFAFAETVQEQQAEGTASGEPGTDESEAEEPEQRSRLRRWLPGVTVGLAAAAALVLAVQVFRPAGLSIGRRDGTLAVALTQLDAATGSYRPLEPRLTGGFPHRPIAPVTRSVTTGEEAPLAVREAALAVEKAASAAGASIDAQRGLSAMYLMTGKPQRAVELLAPLAKGSKDAGLLTDTAAAYVARREPGDAARGLDVAEQAIEADPKSAEAWFNLALAAEALGLPSRANEAWTKYLELDPSSGWAAEARTHLEKLKAPARPAVWQRLRPTFEEALTRSDRERLVPIVTDFREETRRYFDDELLPKWAAAQIAGDGSGGGVALQLQLLAAVLTAGTSDRLPADTIAAIDQLVARNDHGGLDHTSRGIVALADGRRLNTDGRPLEATPRFESAFGSLTSGQSPLAASADFYLSLGDYYGRRLEPAAVRLAAVGRSARERGYLAIQGQSLWMLGLIHLDQGRLAESTADYVEARRVLDRIGAVESTASLDALLGTNLDYLGDSQTAWTHWQRALAAVPDLGSRRRQLTIVHGSVRAAMDLQLPRAALRLQNSAVENAQAWKLPAAIAESLVRRASIYSDLGDSGAATRDLAEAREWLPRIQDVLFRGRIESEVPGAEAQIAFAVDPAGAIDALSKVLEISTWSGSGFRRAVLYRQRGHAYLSAGNIDAAERDYRSAIDVLEAQRAPLAERLQISFFDRGWGAFDDIIALQVFDRARPDLGLEFAERGRARTLLDSLDGAKTRSRPSISDVRRRIPIDTALLYYATTDKALLSWVITHDDIRFAVHSVSTAELADLTATYRRLLERGESNTDILALSARLYEALLRPQETQVAGATTIIVVPDGPLQDLPFAGLLNTRTGRFLVEDHAVGFSPSAAIFDESSAELARRQVAAPSRILVVGNPSSRDDENRLLPSLPNAQAEASEVASYFTDVTLLVGAAATKHQFLYNASTAEVIHFAGHAISNPAHPLLSRLLLSADADPDNGTLFAHELQKVRLASARLVVLAGCSTAAGSAQRGEGVLSLARAFVAAGAPSVVASLWNVDDERSRELFRTFYSSLRRRMSPVAALRAAQLSSIASSRADARALSTWSAFVAIGGDAPPGS